MDGLVEDDDGRAQSGEGDVQTEARGSGLQLLGEVLQVGLRGVSQETEEVVVETVGVGAVYDEVGDGQHLEQQAGALALVGAVALETLGVNHHHAVGGVESHPHPHGAGLLGGRRLEHLPALEEGVVECVGLALSDVPEDGHHFEKLVWMAVQPLHKLLLILDLDKMELKQTSYNSQQMNGFTVILC